MKKKIFNRINYYTFSVTILVCLLIIGIFLFFYNSINVFSNTNKTNFSYSSKVMESVEEIDKIVERGEVNLDVLVDAAQLIYDTDKKYDKNYNHDFFARFNVLTKAALINSPGANGMWFQINAKTADSYRLYSWYIRKNNKVIDLKAWYDRHGGNNRTLTPQDDPYYFEALKSKGTTWSDIYRDADTNVAMITVSRPVYKDGYLVGVMGVDFSLADLVMAMHNMHMIFPEAEILLLDQNSKIMLTEPVVNWSASTLDNFSSMFNSAHLEKKQMLHLVDKGIHKTAVMLSLSNKYHVVIMFPDKEIYKGYNQLFLSVCFVFLVILLLAMKIISYSKKIKHMNVKLADESKKLRDMFNAFPSPIVIKDLKGHFVDCNSMFEKVIGLSVDKIISKTNKELFHPNLAKIFDEHEQQAIDTGEVVVYEVSMPRLTGKGDVHLQKTIVPLYNSNKVMIGLLNIAVDISKSKEEEIYLKKAKDAAEKATAMKSNFLANMSHEIRTPLNGILGFMQLLQDTKTTEEQAEFIRDAQKSSEILLNVINDILDFSKIEADKMQIDNISFNIRSVVEDITVISIANAQSKGIDISSLICSDVPQRVFGDPGRLKQVLNNLVNNAIKFTSQGEVVICVKQEYSDENNSIITFEVKDTGIGIDADKLNLIFEAFTQADASMTRKFGGTGLGLAISQRLVKLMNGKINVDTKIGEGSTFSFSLPFKKDVEVGAQVDKKIKSIAGHSILLVNPKQTENKIMSYYLGEANCVVFQASSIVDAIDVLEQQNYKMSVIIIDSKIQQSGDKEFSALLKQNNKTKNIPLVLSMSIAQRGDSMLAKSKGFNGFLAKPIKKFDLIETISVIVNDGEVTAKSEKFVTKHTVKEIKFDSKIKILVVEDSEINVKLMSKILSNNNLNCDIARNGQEAVDALKQKEYDLIFMDCQMPVMDGYEATIKIRKLEGKLKHTPIVALTANALAKDDERCFKSGMDDYLSKPVKVENLLSMVDKYVNPLQKAEK